MSADDTTPAPGFSGFSLADLNWSLSDLSDGVERAAGRVDAAEYVAGLVNVTGELEGVWNDDWEAQERILDSIHAAMRNGHERST